MVQNAHFWVLLSMTVPRSSHRTWYILWASKKYLPNAWITERQRAVGLQAAGQRVHSPRSLFPSSAQLLRPLSPSPPCLVCQSHHHSLSNSGAVHLSPSPEDMSPSHCHTLDVTYRCKTEERGKIKLYLASWWGRCPISCGFFKDFSNRIFQTCF